jgi:asparagine synthetase B (glutamine-hydrolysing)
MYFTLAIGAATPAACAALTRAALGTDPRSMPIPGPPRLTWQAPDERAAVLHWGLSTVAAASFAGTIWADEDGATLRARTSIARTDPVYLAEQRDAVVLADRASWAASVTNRTRTPDPVMVAAFLNAGFPLGDVTPYRDVRALDGARSVTVTAGHLVRSPAASFHAGSGGRGITAVTAALIAAVTPLAGQQVPVELSLTGGKDSRLIAAALAAAGVPFRARTHGAAGHPDVVVAAAIAARLGVEHIVTTPKPPTAVTETDVLARLRSSVLVADGMLSAFENVGSPDPAFAEDHIHVGGHGGELLRGGYAGYAKNPVRGAAQFRSLTTRRLHLLRPAAAASYLAALSPWAARFARGPLRTLDDFYLVNRAGRWSAAARQAYLLRERLAQPFFDDAVVRAARTVPLRDRVDGTLYRDVLTALCPCLRDIPLAATGAATADWRRSYGAGRAAFFRGYILDQGPALFEVISKPAADRALRTDPETAWPLATLTAFTCGDWLSARP